MPASLRLAFTVAVGLLAMPAFADEKLQYNRDVRPILAENCFACHGPDSAARKAGLRLDQSEKAIESEAIIPGKPEKSGIIARILLPDADKKHMPPANSHKNLTAAQREILKRWVAEGAEYQPHWSFLPPKRPGVPTVKFAAWVKNPIDAFVLAELEKRGLQPAPEADRRTIARRLSLDLIGLPPKPEDVELFVNDNSPNYYEIYVAKLLASPHWGEHRGRYWLDAARYADTHGIHFDNYREIWAYRDWVIRAFNENMKFDQFTLEQLAGDLLPNPTLDQQVATGFNRCNITTNEGGAISEEYLVLYTRDRTETVNQVWMGLTAGCAVCHDHKFDPITARDFYSMSAFFNNTSQNAMDGNISNTPPIINVPKSEDRVRFSAIGKDLAAARAKLEARKTGAKTDYTAWLKTVKPDELETQVPTDGLTFHAPFTEGTGKTSSVTVAGKERKLDFSNGYGWGGTKNGRTGLLVQPTGQSPPLADVGDFDNTQAFTVSAWAWNSTRNQTGAILARMDVAPTHRGWDLWMQGDKIGFHLISTWAADALKVVAKAPLPFSKWTHVTMSYDGTLKSSGVQIYYDGVSIPFDIEADALKSTTKTKVPFKIGQRSVAERVNNVAIQDVRIFERKLSGDDVKALAKSQRSAEIIAKPAEKRTPQEVEELFTWWLATNDADYKKFSNEVNTLQAEEAAIKARGTTAYVASEKATPPEAYILLRGDYDKRKDKVTPATPKALPPLSDDAPRNRLGFAKWLLKDEHPLTARVTVNRFWQELYGNGLVRTSGDFGISGELPSHPELLDWLALEFREGGWDMKKFFTMLVTSNTYRQSAAITKEKLEKDPSNRFLSRGARYRMDAEMLRDYALAASGSLVPKLGGPSVKPYQPVGVWEAVAMIGSNTRDYKADTGENLYRRSMYTFWKRSAPPASMEIFNAPNRETCAVRRERTNTPLQALVTLNDVQFVEAARRLAEAAMKGETTYEARLDFIAKRLLARSFRAEEQPIVKAVYDNLAKHYQTKPDDAKKLIAVGDSKADPKLNASELAAWTMVANELLNLDEVLNK